MRSDEPRLDETRLRDLLREHFTADKIMDLEPLRGGVFARAFGFRAGHKRYVARLSSFDHSAGGYAKDDYAQRHFASPHLPIPRIVAVASTEVGHLAIGERAPGRTLDEMTPAERKMLLPAMLDTFDAIIQADVSASSGYGFWAADGIGTSASWHDYLAAVIENHTQGFYKNWHAMFETTFLERDVYETIYQGMLRLLPYCPETRSLIHNDAHFENVLGEGDRITAVIDWANAIYGDPLYEIARLDWWSAWPGWWYDDVGDQLQARYGDAPNFAERMACYQLHLGLDDLRYYATAGQPDDYARSSTKLLALAERGPGRAVE
jgi:hygromycin-B 4-O-kinase